MGRGLHKEETNMSVWNEERVAALMDAADANGGVLSFDVDVPALMQQKLFADIPQRSIVAKLSNMDRAGTLTYRPKQTAKKPRDGSGKPLTKAAVAAQIAKAVGVASLAGIEKAPLGVLITLRDAVAQRVSSEA